MLVLISGLVLLLTSAALVGYQYWLFRQTMRSTLSVRGRILATNTTASLAFANDADARELLAALRADPHIVAAALYDKNGHLFATYPANLPGGDRKSTRLNSSHGYISYAVFCLKKKKPKTAPTTLSRARR